jgi:hypothetical protein
MFAPLIEHPIVFPIIFVIVLALVSGWRVARSTKLVGRLWLAVSTLWVAFCVSITLFAHHPTEDWNEWSMWGTFLFACAWIPFLLLMVLRYIRLGYRGP